jgi:hypothetical protein
VRAHLERRFFDPFEGDSERMAAGTRADLFAPRFGPRITMIHSLMCNVRAPGEVSCRQMMIKGL